MQEHGADSLLSTLKVCKFYLNGIVIDALILRTRFHILITAQWYTDCGWWSCHQFYTFVALDICKQFNRIGRHQAMIAWEKNPHTNWFCNESVTVSLIEKIWNLFDYPQSIDFNGQHFTVVKSNYFWKKLRSILIEIQRCKFDFIFIRMKCVNFHTIQKGT